MIRKILSFLFILVAGMAQAQDGAAPEMADQFRADGKIYVVISVIGIVFLAIVLFLVYIERKLKKLEADIKDLKA